MPTMSQDFVFSESITVSYVPATGGFPCCEITQYEILVNSSNGNQSFINNPLDVSLTFSALPNTEYQMFIRAWNSEGPGRYSLGLTVFTNPGSVGPARYISSTVHSITFEWDALVQGDFIISNYVVSISPYLSGDGTAFVSGKTNATFTMLEANRQYAIVVQAEGVFELGSKNASSVVFMSTAPSAPPSPVASTASPPTTSMITIEWSCAEFRGCLDITRYQINWVQIGGNQSDSGSEVIDTDPDSCEFAYQISGLRINTFYSISITAGNDQVFGPPSDPIEICTNPAVPDPPSVQLHHQQQAIIVEWEPPIVGGGVEITMYNIAWSSASDSGHKQVTVSNSNHTAVITGLLPVTTYEVTVQAINGHGTSSVSTTGTVTTGSGIICTEAPIIRLTAEDLARFGAVAGDQIVVSSREINYQPAANQLTSQCKIPALVGGAAEFHFNLTDCEPLVGFVVDKFDGVDNTTLLYTYTVQLARFTVLSNVVQRFDPTVSFDFHCVFNRSLAVVSDNVQPNIAKDLVAMDPGHGQFDLTLDFFTSDHYNTSLVGSPPTVEVLTFVFAQLSLGVETNNVVLQAEYCWATLASSPEDPVSYPIIVDGCPADNTYDEPGAILVTRNYQLNTVQFQFKAFVWANIPDRDQTMFVHCNTMVCDPRNEEGCTDLNCGSSRKRRNVPVGGKIQRVTYGPIMLINKGEDLCAEANGGCEDLCVVENQSIKCLCTAGQKLNIDGRTCSANKYYGAKENQEVPQFVYLVLVAVLLVALVGLSIHKKQS
uniref:Alpha-tectorin-like n=1 Tax=Phallusia mammillata TaxID=59560 RepID=A0A6F9DV59_9ASCI|nr:alpha-tectorin-like [Phallusia mammillata]